MLNLLQTHKQNKYEWMWAFFLNATIVSPAEKIHMISPISVNDNRKYDRNVIRINTCLILSAHIYEQFHFDFNFFFLKKKQPTG